MIVVFSQILFFIAIAGIFLVLLGYPFMIAIAGLFTWRRKPAAPSPPLTVSLIVVVHNGADLVSAKVQNALSLEYPGDRLEILFYSDGSNDGTAEQLKALNQPGIHALIAEQHEGKYKGLNHAARVAGGEILVFSDMDALVEPQALSRLVRHFADDRVGGVCGRRRVGESGKPLSGAQRFYVTLNSRLKQWESRLGSITANDGKLYAIRKHLFRPVPPGVTDDLFMALSVIGRGKKFIFEPDAVTAVKLPARDARHEVARRRRIVSQSLNSIFRHRQILDPGKHGFYAVQLLINKVLRRCLPLFFIILLPSSLVLHNRAPLYALLFWAQLFFYLCAGAFPLIPEDKKHTLPSKVASIAFYICSGMYGTLLGWVDFLRKPPPAKWTPVKKDS